MTIKSLYLSAMQLAIMIRRSALLLTGWFSLFPSGAIAQTSQPAPVPQSQPTAKPETSPPSEIGFEFEGSPKFNYTQVNETTYTGDCPGVVRDRESFKARFRSSKTSPGEGRRVLIRNVTTGMAGDPAPYTDREYNKDRLSEATNTEFGTEHNSRNLRVAFGINTFDYQIRERDQVIEAGQFLSNFMRNSQQLVRDAQWYNAQICANSSVALNVCADVRRQKQYRCPDGKVLRRERIEPDDSGIRTLIANQSDRSVSIKAGDDIYRLQPGERVRIRRVSTSSFPLYYNGECSNCSLQQYNSVSPGLRVRLVNNGKGAQGNRVRLETYPNTNPGFEE